MNRKKKNQGLGKNVVFLGKKKKQVARSNEDEILERIERVQRDALDVSPNLVRIAEQIKQFQKRQSELRESLDKINCV